MNPMKKVFLLVCAAAAISFTVFADAQKAAEKPEVVIKRTLEAARADVKVKAITMSELPGLYAVELENGPEIYASADGKYFVLGDLFQVDAKGFANISEQKRNGERAKLLADVKLSDMIIFKPKTATKGVVNVFTDVECGWCQRFHQEVPKLNAMGIEVRYLAFPRAGVGSEDYKKMVTAWCAKDRQGTLTRYKNRETVPLKECPSNPVAAQYQLGERIGVNGTPTLITAAGEMIPGYVPPADLAQRLGVK